MLAVMSRMSGFPSIERAQLRRRHLRGRLVLRGNRRQFGIASALVATDETCRERPAAEWQAAGCCRRRSAVFSTAVGRCTTPGFQPTTTVSPSRMPRPRLVWTCTPSCSIGDVGLLGGSIRATEGRRAHAGHAGGQPHLRRRRFDRHFPLVAGHVPVQLVVLVEEAQAVRRRDTAA